MPTYEYRCLKCKKKFDQLQRMSDKKLTKCIHCKGKRSYRSETAAQSVIFKLRARGGGTDGLAPYNCGFCSQWHLGRPTYVVSRVPTRPSRARIALPYKDDDA